jgi:hypothetical protein
MDLSALREGMQVHFQKRFFSRGGHYGQVGNFMSHWIPACFGDNSRSRWVLPGHSDLPDQQLKYMS